MSSVTVIGGGLIGLASALRLADAGHTVTLMDPSPASGATHHAGGMLAPVAEVVYRQEDLFPLMVRSAELYPGLLEVVAKHTGLSTGHRGGGRGPGGFSTPVGVGGLPGNPRHGG